MVEQGQPFLNLLFSLEVHNMRHIVSAMTGICQQAQRRPVISWLIGVTVDGAARPESSRERLRRVRSGWCRIWSRSSYSLRLDTGFPTRHGGLMKAETSH